MTEKLGEIYDFKSDEVFLRRSIDPMTNPVQLFWSILCYT